MNVYPSTQAARARRAHLRPGPAAEQEFISLLAETAADGRTVFLSSHDLDEVQRAVHRLAIIREGRIVVYDTDDGLRRHAPRTIELVFDRDVTPPPSPSSTA